MHPISPRRKLQGLIAVNAALLGVLAAVTLSPSTFAQRGSRARGAYMMVSGKIVGGNAHAVYILDASNQDMIAARWNETTQSLDVIGYRDIQADTQNQPGR
jgi:hypothetical protein